MTFGGSSGTDGMISSQVSVWAEHLWLMHSQSSGIHTSFPNTNPHHVVLKNATIMNCTQHGVSIAEGVTSISVIQSIVSANKITGLNILGAVTELNVSGGG